MLERNAPATWLNSLSYEGKPAALGKGEAHWSGAVAEQCSRGVNVWGYRYQSWRCGERGGWCVTELDEG
jgi:hypothetical protein